jgi:hypothetical protein
MLARCLLEEGDFLGEYEGINKPLSARLSKVPDFPELFSLGSPAIIRFLPESFLPGTA